MENIIDKSDNISTKDKKDYEYCDDDCIYCDEREYCPFNEVKHE